MSKIILIASCMLVFYSNLFADPGYYDLFVISVDEETYYFPGLSRGVIKSDLSYYSAEGNYLYEVDSIFRLSFPKDSVTLFKDLDSIDVRKFSDFSYGNNHIYNFTNGVKFSREYLLENYRLIHAYNIHAAGYQKFTRDLKTADNAWIQQNEIEKLFEIQKEEYREYAFFGIKGKVGEMEKEAIKSRLMKKIDNETAFADELSTLYRRKIIMLCICWE